MRHIFQNRFLDIVSKLFNPIEPVTLLPPNMRPVPRNPCPANTTGMLIAFYLIYIHADMIEYNYPHIVCIRTVVSLLLFPCLLCYQIHILDRA